MGLTMRLSVRMSVCPTPDFDSKKKRQRNSKAGSWNFPTDTAIFQEEGKLWVLKI